MLGVSEPALRAWTDEGEVKAFVTPGGHRRYLKSDLKKFIGQIQQQSSVKQLTDQLEGTAPVHRKIDEMFFQSNSGPTIHDDTWQDRFASLGRQLLALLTQCVTRPSKPEETISTAKDIGRQFGELTLELGVPLIDSMRAFVQHRDPVLKAIFDLRKNGEASERQIADAVPLVNRAMDEALVAMTAVRMSSR
ncbi:DNA binding domain protein excisionase family [Dehalogenimonas sp. WBC-2]|nr:DNA binding domain protein excisionase family [Dehalogenimonas sp. WBC-2]